MASRKNQPLVSIVIVNWNGLADTRLCLEHTRKQTYENKEIIVVDNGSADDSVSYLERQTDITLVRNTHNEGFTGGHIAGLKAARGSIILLLNNDAVMDPNYLLTGVSYLQDHPETAVLGGRAYLWDEQNPLFEKSNSFYAYQNINPITAEGIFQQTDEGLPREVNNVSGSCVFVRKQVIDEVGYLHNPFFAYYEESDLFARIKRAGHVVTYHPGLAIWHANGKTALRKGSSFSFYMMMRNRFRFAVRNFDGWSLRRFLFFYLKMGMISSAKALLPKDAYDMDRAYARAFWHNVFAGGIAFTERRRLRLTLGTDINYSERIRLEQTSISVVTVCTTKRQITDAVTLGRIIDPRHEVVIVVKEPTLVTYARQFCDIFSQPIRLCIDRGLFDVPSENIGILSAKGSWLILQPSDLVVPSVVQLHGLMAELYTAQKHGRVVISPFVVPPGASLDVIGQRESPAPLLIERTFCRDAGGLQSAVKPATALHGLIGLAATLQRLQFAGGCPLEPSTKTAGQPMTDPYAAFVAELARSVHEAESSRKPLTGIDHYLTRHYHLQQLVFLSRWLLSPRIKLRLKLARSKNIVLSLLTLRRRKFATELKHIRNEMLSHKFAVVDLDARKAAELALLELRRQRPSETPVFIITRDRNIPLQQLVKWLNSCGLHRIVLIDNDSALPPLTDYLRKTEYQVIETLQNVGHTVPWASSVIKLLAPDDFYIVSDPDVIPVRRSLDVIKHLYDIHRTYPNHLKIGLGLNIDDLPDRYDLKGEVVRWESQFWQHPIGDDIYEAGVDTTFALYKPYTYAYFLHPSIRTGGAYTARHLPWYADSRVLSDEEVFYRLRADQNVNTWNKGELPERYVKELERQRH